jgi:(p)ppGpp synthase/HD superfamily hydrolase
VVRVEANDRSGLLRDITTILANEKVNVLGVAMRLQFSELIAVGAMHGNPAPLSDKADDLIARDRPQNRTKDNGRVVVEGVGNLMHHIARCCQPIPGDECCSCFSAAASCSAALGLLNCACRKLTIWLRRISPPPMDP